MINKGTFCFFFYIFLYLGFYENELKKVTLIMNIFFIFYSLVQIIPKFKSYLHLVNIKLCGFSV